jgi:D-sedoheptulose 7-phosphate isomerase
MKYQTFVSELTDILSAFFSASSDTVKGIVDSISNRLKSGSKVLIFGNGGSAAQAQHFAAEMVGRFQSEREGLPVIALTADSPCLTAIGNDLGFGRVFARQVEALGRPGDVAIGLSTSGESENVIKALAAAAALEMITVALTGEAGGGITGKTSPSGRKTNSSAKKNAKDKGIPGVESRESGGGKSQGPDVEVDYLLAVPSLSTPRIQEVHLVILHILAEEIEKQMNEWD